MSRAIICFLSLIVLAPFAFAQATFHGNIARTGAYTSSGPRQLTGVKWTFKTEGPILSSPAIAAGTVFIGSIDGCLYAVGQQTGQQKWKYQTKGPVSSSPAVADGIVYFGGSDGFFYALAADSGALKWRFATQGERRFEAKNLHGYETKNQMIPDSWDLFLSSPAIFDGGVYFGSGDGHIYALDAQTGALKWKFATQDVVHSSPAIAGGVLYIGGWDSFLYALDARTGVERWRFKTGDDPQVHNQVGIQSSPAVVDGVVYFGCRDAHVYAVDAADGRKKWDYSTRGSWVIGTPAVGDGSVYVGTSDSHLFLGFEAKTGKPKFTLSAKGLVFSSAALAGDLVYVGDFSGRMTAMDAKSGATVWQFQTESSKRDPLKLLGPDGAINEKAVFVSVFRDYQDMVLSITNLFSLGAIMSSPVVDRGAIYFGSTDGILYALV